MNTATMILLTVLIAVGAASVAGILIGKHKVKVKRSDYRPILTKKERIIYIACVLAGCACIAGGIFYKPAPSGNVDGDFMNPGMTDDVYAGDEIEDGGGDALIDDGNTSDETDEATDGETEAADREENVEEESAADKQSAASTTPQAGGSAGSGAVTFRAVAGGVVVIG